MKIGVFDSGIGGLTVLKELVSSYPNNEYIYIGDTKNIPYGNKTKEELLNLSIKIIDYFISIKVDKIIIACGTISSNISNLLKQKYTVDIIDIISPTINYLKNNKYNNIGVLATKMTVNSKIFSTKLHNKKVIEVECPKLVPAIESKDENKIDNYLHEYLSIFKDNKIDILVLGCTHYPIIKDNIKKILDNDIEILNMANPVLKLLSNNTTSQLEIYFTKVDSNVINNTKTILSDIKGSINEIKL